MDGKTQLSVGVSDAPSEALAAPFSPMKSDKFLGFEISKVGLRSKKIKEE